MALVDPDCFEGLSTQEQLQQIFEAAREIAINGGGGGGPFQPLSDMLTALSTGDGSGLTSVPGSSLTGGFTASGMTMSTDRLLGRDTAGSGAVEEISLGTGFALSSGSLVTTFTQTGTGAIARTYDSRLKDWVSVKDFGAAGDDSTDDTLAIQAAIDSGKSVWFPDGTYKITASLKPKAHGQMFMGSGMRRTIIKQYTAAAHAFELVSIAGPIHGGESYGLVFQDFTVLGPGSFNSGLHTFSGSTGDGFHFARPSATTYFTDHILVRNVDCELLSRCAYFAGIGNATLIHCQFGYANYGIYTEGSTNNSIVSVRLVTSNCATRNIYLGSGVNYQLGLGDTNASADIGAGTQLEIATGVLANIYGGNFEQKSDTGYVIHANTNSTLNLYGCYLNRGSGGDGTAIQADGTVTACAVSIGSYTTKVGGSGRYFNLGPGVFGSQGSSAYVGVGTIAPGHPLQVIHASSQPGVNVAQVANEGAFVQSLGANDALWMAAAYNNGSWLARSTSASIYQQNGGQHIWYYGTGLTAGNTFSPTLGMLMTNAGQVRINHNTISAQFSVVSGAAGTRAAVIRAAASPSVNILEVRDSTDAVKVAIESDFNLTRIAGTSTAAGSVPCILYQSITPVGNVGAGEDDLISQAIAASVLATNGDRLRITTPVTFAANANNKRVRTYWNAVNIYDSTALAINAGSAEIVTIITRTGAATQNISTRVVSGNATLAHSYTRTTGAATLSGAVTFKLTGEATSNNDVVEPEMTIEYLPAP